MSDTRETALALILADCVHAPLKASMCVTCLSAALHHERERIAQGLEKRAGFAESVLGTFGRNAAEILREEARIAREDTDDGDAA